MKSYITTLVVSAIITLLPYYSNGQVKVAADPDLATPADPSAVLDVFSNTKGMLPPRMTTAERDAVTAPADGLTIYNTDENCINVYHNTAWQSYCKLRYNVVCGCVEYLNDYGLPTEAWIGIANPTDSDWYEVGTTTAPDLITDDIYTEGKATIGGQTNNLGRLNVYGENSLANAATYMELTGASGSAPQRTLSLYQNVTYSSDKAGIYNLLEGTSTGNVIGLDQIINHSGAQLKHGIANEFTALSNGISYGMTNVFSSGSTSTKYGVRNDFPTTANGTNYGFYNYFNTTSTSLKYGMFNSFTATTGGTKTGVRNYFPSGTTTGTIYGVNNAIFNDGTSPKYGVYNTLSGIGAGTAYGTYNNILMNSTNTSNAYGVYSNVSNNGSGIGYAGYFRTTGNGNYGVYGYNLSNGGRAGAFVGNVEIGRGWLVVGDDNVFSNTDEYDTGTRYGVWEGSFLLNPYINFDYNGYRYFNLGQIDLPADIPANVVATKIIWEMDGYHQDANEDHGFWIALENPGYQGAAGWYGWFGNAGNGAKDLNWHYVSPALNDPISNTQNIEMRVEDDCCFGDNIQVFNIHLKIYYRYTALLEDGGIAASGLIYANSNNLVGDLAEHFEVNNEHPIEYGLIVGLKPGGDNEYEICSTPYSNHMVGVISEKPSVVLNAPSVGPPVALQGRVKVKLVNSDVLIKSGDHLTTSDTPGHAQKATRMGKVIGYAVTNQKAGTDFVDILVQPGLHLPQEKEEEEKGESKPKGRIMSHGE